MLQYLPDYHLHQKSIKLSSRLLLVAPCQSETILSHTLNTVAISSSVAFWIDRLFLRHTVNDILLMMQLKHTII